MSKQQTSIGSCPAHWKVVKLHTVAELKHGYQFRTEDFTQTGIKIFKITQIKADGSIDISSCSFIDSSRFNSFKKNVIGKGDILMALSGATIGKIARFKSDETVLQNYRVGNFIPHDEEILNKSYFYYFLTTENTYYQILANQNQSAQENVGKEDIHNMFVFLPPLPEQTAIAEVLSSLDDKIDLLQRQNKTLEQLAETLFNDKLRVNSEQWVEKPLSDLITTTLGGEWGKETPEGDFTKQVCCIRGTDIADLQIGLADRTPVRFVKEKKFENIQPLDGDLILEISGGTDDQSTGRTIYINELNRKLFPYPLIFSNFCRLIRPAKKEYSYFLYLYIQYLYNKDEFFNLENGSSGIKNLDYKYLLNELNFLLPNKENEILEFNDQVKIYFEIINKNKHQIRTLTQLRDTLLPKLMSGEVRVKMN